MTVPDDPVTVPDHRGVIDWGRMVVFFGGTSWDGNRFPDQHIAERLSAWVPVLYVDPPVAVYSPHSGWAAVHRPRLVGDQIARFTPIVLPAKGRGPMRSVTAALVRRQAARAVRDLGGSAHVVVAATLFPVFGTCGERRRVFYATDDFRAGASLMNIPESWVRQREVQAIAQADVVVAVSDYLADALRSRGAAHPVVIENGVDHTLFATTDEAATPGDVTLPRPIVGFIGHLSDRIDLAMLEATAGTGCSLLLVGPKSIGFEMDRMERLLDRPNVQWVGAKPFDELPSYLKVMDVGLLPYTDTEFNRSSFPLKVLEYLAAGRPAVVSDLPAIRTLGDTVHIAADPDAFAIAVIEELEAPPDPAARSRRIAAAADRSWDAAASRFAEAIGVR